MRPKFQKCFARLCAAWLITLATGNLTAQDGTFPAANPSYSTGQRPYQDPAQTRSGPPPASATLRPAAPVQFATTPPSQPRTSAADSWNSRRPEGRLVPRQAAPNTGPVITASGTRTALAGTTTLPVGQIATGSANFNTSIPATKRTPLNPSSKAKLAADEREPSSTLQTLVSIGSSLIIVLGLFLGVAWFYRKTLSTSMGSGIPKQVVEVLGRTPIATRQQLVLVRFGPKLVLISMVQGEARPISEITDPLEVDQLAGLCESSKPNSVTQSFRKVLSQGAKS